MKAKKVIRHCATCAHYAPETEECWHALPDWVLSLVAPDERWQSPEDNYECAAWEKDVEFADYEE